MKWNRKLRKVYGEVQLTGSFKTNKLKATSRRQAIERRATLLHNLFDGLLMVNQLKRRTLPISKAKKSQQGLNRPYFLADRLFRMSSTARQWQNQSQNDLGVLIPHLS